MNSIVLTTIIYKIFLPKASKILHTLFCSEYAEFLASFVMCDSYHLLWTLSFVQ